MNQHVERLRRILLVRNDRIGDLVLTLPALEAIRRHAPHAHLSALVSGHAGSLLTGSHAVDELLIDAPRDSAWQLGRRLKSMDFDAAVVFNTTTRACLAVRLAGIRTRVMWGYKPAGFLMGTHRVMVHRSHPPIHESEFAMAFARQLGLDVEPNPPPPRLAVDAATRQRVAARVQRVLGTSGPLFGVHPGSRNSSYNWPERHYIELIAQLTSHGRVIVTGSPAETPLAERIVGRVAAADRRRVGIFCDFSLPEMAAVLAELTSLTVSSTGPMHMAAVLGTPVVALFSPHPVHAPAKWAPLGANHMILVAPLAPDEDPRVKPERASSVMARIAVDQVVEANLYYARRARAATARGPMSPPSTEQAA